MTIPSNVTRNSYTGTGITGPYPVTFKFFEDADLKVTVADANGVETVKVLTTDYTVTGAGEQAGGSITFTTAVTTGYSIVIEPKADQTQDTDIKNEGGNLRESIEDRFDRLCRDDQVQQNLIDRSVKVQITDVSVADPVLPPREAGALIGWNDSGTGFANRSASLLAQDAPVTATGSTSARWLSDRFAEVTNVRDFGAIGDGVSDDTAAIQAAIDSAAEDLTNTFPPSGSYKSPTVLLPPGLYRLTDTLVLPAGVTLRGNGGVAYTVEATRLVMDTNGGTTNLDKHIVSVTRFVGNSQITNNACGAIEDIGFWIVNPGATISGRGGSAFNSDAVTGLGTDGTGSCIYFAEDTVDYRIKRCNFYTYPYAGIWYNGASATNQGGEVHECEFDSAITNIHINDGICYLRIHGNLFFGGTHALYVNNCTGILKFIGNECEGLSGYMSNDRIVVKGTAKLDQLHFVGNRFDTGSLYGNLMNVESAKVVTITGNTFGISINSTIFVKDAVGGVISGNSIIDSGYSATIYNNTNDPAAIKLEGCQGVVVSGNAIVSPDSATYGGYGIFSLDGSSASRCVFVANHVAGVYSGAPYRSQLRYINVSSGDTLAYNNVGETGRAEIRDTQTTNGRVDMSTSFAFTTNKTESIDLSLVFDAVVTVGASPYSSTQCYTFDVQVQKSPVDATYRIVNISRNGTSGVGNGPHVISAGNTLTFAISGNSLTLTSALTTDPFNTTVCVSGRKGP